ILELVGQPKSAEEHRLRRVRKVVHMRYARGAVCIVAARDVRDAARAFPLVLMRAPELPELRHKLRSLGRAHVPDLLPRIAEGTQQIGLAAIAPGQLRAGADARHLRAAGFTSGFLAPALARDVRKQLRRARIRHIEDRRAVLLELAVERVDGAPAMRADIGDPAIALALDGRLIRATGREIVKADAAQIARLVLSRTG